MREGTIFQLAVKPKDFPAGLRLRNLEWGVLFAVDGTTPVGQLRRAFALGEEEIGAICTLLLEKGLIREREVSLTEYMAAQTSANGKQSQTLLELLQGGTALRAMTSEIGRGGASHLPGQSLAAGGTPSAMQGAKITPMPVPPPLPPEAFDQAKGGGESASGSPEDVRSTPAAQQNGHGGVNGFASTPDAYRHTPNGAGASAATLPQAAAALAALAEAPADAPVTPAIIPFTPLHTVSATNTADSSSTVTIMPNASVNGSNPRVEQTVTGPVSGAPQQGARRMRLSLKNVVEFVLGRAPDLNAGHLDVYRIFIRVNTQLLKRNGIHSLRFEEDRIITDAELQEAILNSVQKTLGVSCPREVFI